MESILREPEAYGNLGVGESIEDYQLAGGILELPKPRHKFDEIQIAYHQPTVSTYSCTVISAAACVSNLIGKGFSYEQLKEMWAEAIKRGANPNFGWDMKSAVDLVRQFTKKFFGIEVSSFIVELASQEYFDALDKGYMVNIGYSASTLYDKDKKDGRLDGTSFGPKTYGHAVSSDAAGPNDIEVVDQYKDNPRKVNKYPLGRGNVRKLVSNKVFFRLGYVFAVTEDFQAMNQVIEAPIWAIKSIEKVKGKGLITDWSDPLAPVELNADAQKSRFEWVIAKLGGPSALFDKLGLLTKPGEEFTLSHLAVVLDRAGFAD